MYGERFDIPEPDKLIFISWFEGGEVFRSGCCWERGNGRIFYFRPGHEAYPTYHNETVIRVITNGCRWARRRVTLATDKAPNAPALEAIEPKEAHFGRAGCSNDIQLSPHLTPLPLGERQGEGCLRYFVTT